MTLLVIVGPTAAGKSTLGEAVAQAIGGEIVSADAFAVYRGLDIGTDKPDADARARVRHHLVDIADPRIRFSAGDFVAAADRAITEIVSRGAVPVVVGGSHFYVRALLLGLFPAPPRDPKLGAALAAEWERAPERVRLRLAQVDPEAARRIAANDRQRILRALEVFEASGVPMTEQWRRLPRAPRYPALLVAPRRARVELYARIDMRVDRMFSSGLVEEVAAILASGVPSTAHALNAIGYKEVVALLEERLDLPSAIAGTKLASRKLAKRQLTWLRNLREARLHWVEPAEMRGVEEVVALFSDFCHGE